MAQTSENPSESARSARAALTEAEAAVRAIEAKPPAPPGALAASRQKRYAAAEAFRTAARAWAAADPGNAAAKSALTDADQSARKYFMPRGVTE